MPQAASMFARAFSEPLRSLEIVRPLGDIVAGLYRSSWARFITGASAAFVVIFHYSHFRLFAGGDSALLISALLRSTLSVLWFFALLGLHRWLFVVGITLSSIASAVVLHYTHTYHIFFNENTAAVLFEATADEIQSHFGRSACLYVLAGIALGAGASMGFCRRRCSLELKAKLAFVLLALIGHGLLPIEKSLRMRVDEILPFSLVTRSYIYLSRQDRVRELLARRADISNAGAHGRYSDLTVVLVIGESSRPDHFHLNGYPRRTSDHLERWNAISYPDARSCATVTRVAVPCMLTRATLADPSRVEHETSLISVFRRAGFSTAWLSNQGLAWGPQRDRDEMAAATLAAIAGEADRVEIVNKTGSTVLLNHDEHLLPSFDQALARTQGNGLFVLHLIGSHWRYDYRYPPDFTRFSPACSTSDPSACTQEELVNAYDNTIAYTDHVLDQIISRIEDRTALLLFVSDHGESLGENGIYCHGGGDPEEQRRVAFFAWGSERFVARAPAAYEHLRSNRMQPISHDHLFHTLLDCSGIESPVIEPALSLCNKGARARN